MMKKIWLIFGVASLFLVPLAWTHSLPRPAGLVNDLAGLLTAAERQELELNLADFAKTTGAAMVVLMVPALDGEPIEDLAVQVFEDWGIGQKQEDNGVLLLIAKDDRQARVEVGYGLEPYLPDGLVGSLLDDNLRPAFKENRFGEGVKKTVAAIQQVIIDKGAVSPVEPVARRQLMSWPVVLVLFNLGFYFLEFLARSKSFWLGGVIGVGLGWVISLFLQTSFYYIIFYGLVGLLLDYLFSKNYASRRARGLPTDFWSSGGGFFGGFGGSSGGDGFGGFGGGLSGGGGASRRW